MKQPVSIKQFLHPLAVFVLLISGQQCTADEAGNTFFEKKIRPVLVQHCFKCHSAKTADEGGGVRLDRKLTDVKRLIAPGDVDNSLLITALSAGAAGCSSASASFRRTKASTGDCPQSSSSCGGGVLAQRRRHWC